jgi:hypothetical protein
MSLHTLPGSMCQSRTPWRNALMLHTVRYWFGKIFHLLLESRHADGESWESRQSLGSLGYLGSLYGCRSQTAVLRSLNLTLSTTLHCQCSLPIMEPLNLIRTMSHGAVSATGGLAGGARGAIATQGTSSETALKALSNAYYTRDYIKNYSRVCSLAEVQEFGRCFLRTPKKVAEVQDKEVGYLKKYRVTDSFSQNFKTIAFRQASLVWTSSEQSMACPNSTATGHYYPFFALFRIFKCMEQGDKMSNKSVNYVSESCLSVNFGKKAALQIRTMDGPARRR